MLQEPLTLVAIYIAGATALRWLAPHRITNTIFAIVLVASCGYLFRNYSQDIVYTWGRVCDSTSRLLGGQSQWPPTCDRTFPDLELLDQDGKRTRLSEFRGKVILVEYVGMSCPACIAFSGGPNRGAFEGNHPQPNLDSVRNYAKQYGNVDWNESELVFVQILWFNAQMEPPTVPEATRWAKHFGLKRAKNKIVLIGNQDMATDENCKLVPGFQLIDRNFMLRSDSCGEHPRHNLYTELLPLLGQLLQDE